LYEFKPWQGDDAYKKAWDYLDMCLVANAKEYDKVVKAGEEPTFWQVKAVKLFAKRLDLLLSVKPQRKNKMGFPELLRSRPRL